MFKKSIFSVIIILLISIVFIAAYYLTKEPGDTVDNFSINNYDGNTYSLDMNKDAKATVLIFVSTQCPNVKIYDNRINQIANEYQSKGFVIWGINSNYTEPVEEVKEHSVKVNYNFPVLKDLNNTVADMLGATRTPEVFVIDKNRVVLYHGRIDDNREIENVTSSDLKNALDDINSGRDISVKSTKSFGCSIKRVDK